MTSQQLTATAQKKLGSGDTKKAEKVFTKALAKDPNYAPASFGLGQVAFAKGDVKTAIEKTEEGIRFAPDAYAQHFDLAKWYCVRWDTAHAIQHLYALYRDSLYRQRVIQSDGLTVFDQLRQSPAYRRWHAGIRRIRIQPLDAYSTESDKGTENDQFVTVVSEGRVVLTTKTIQDKNQAYWTADYVVLDTYADSLIIASQLDDDYMFCDVLSSGMIDPKVMGEVITHATNSHLRLMVSDSNEPVSTTGTSLPTTPSLSTTLKDVQAKRILGNPEELDKTKGLK